MAPGRDLEEVLGTLLDGTPAMHTWHVIRELQQRRPQDKTDELIQGTIEVYLTHYLFEQIKGIPPRAYRDTPADKL